MNNLANLRMGCAAAERMKGVALAKAGDAQGARRAFSTAKADFITAAEMWETSNCHSTARACRSTAHCVDIQLKKVKD